jgi:predicted DNA-binding transcriptional regulator YafY
VSIEWEEESLSVVTPHFRRPMRLSMRELCALELGLSIVRREWPIEERPAIDRALERLRGVITRLPTNEMLEGVLAADAHAPGDEHLPAIRQGITGHRKLRLAYRSGASTETRERTIEPYRLVFASGMWYLVARADGGDDVRFFRLDRVESVVITDERFEPSDALQADSALNEGRMFSAEASDEMIVRYSARIARWIAEREDGEHRTDGSFVVRHPLGDLNWGVRHVLQYGVDAEALAPPELRRAIVEALDRMEAVAP